jgi:cytochrome c oxidase subunit I
MSVTVSPATTAAVEQAAFGDVSVAESWLTTTDHRRLGRLHLGAALALGAVGAVLFAFVAQRVDAAVRGTLGTRAWLGESPDAGFSFGRILSASQMGLLLVVVGPMFLALASIVIPQQIGSTRLAFPRLHAFVVWSYLVGAALFVASFVIIDGAPSVNLLDSSPANLITGKAVNRATDLLLASLAVVALSTLLGAINIFTTVLTHRRAGLSLEQVRPFTWASFVTASLSILTLPVYVAGLLLLYIDQHFGGTFGGTEGSNVVWSHMLGLTTRPDFYLLLIPAVGLVGEVVVSRTRKPLLGGPVAAYLVALAGALTLLAWLGGSTAADSFIQPTSRWFTSLIVIPLGLLALVWLGSLAGGLKPDVSLVILGVPLLLVLGAVNVLIAGARGFDASQGAFWNVGQIVLLGVGIPVLAGVAGIAELGPIFGGRFVPKPIAGLAGLSALGGAAAIVVGFAAMANRNDTTKSAPALSIVVAIGGLLLAGAFALTLLGLLAPGQNESTDVSHLQPNSSETN